LSIPKVKLGYVAPSPWLNVRGSRSLLPSTDAAYEGHEPWITAPDGTLWWLRGFRNYSSDSANPDGEMFQFNDVTGKWASLPMRLPDRLNAVGAVFLNDGKTLVITGGVTNMVLPGVESTKIYSMDVTAMPRKWVDRGNLPLALRGHTSKVLPNGKVLLCGGVAGPSVGTASLATLELDPTTWLTTSKADMPLAKNTETGVVQLSNGNILVPIYAYSGVDINYLVYDWALGTWETLRMTFPTTVPLTSGTLGIGMYPPTDKKALLHYTTGSPSGPLLLEYSETSKAFRPVPVVPAFNVSFYHRAAKTPDGKTWSLKNNALTDRLLYEAPVVPRQDKGSLTLDFKDNRYYAGTDVTPEETTAAALLTVARTGVATLVDYDGYIKTAAENAPRIDYDPLTMYCRGLLIEESRTNYRLNSAVIANGVSSVVSTAAFESPDKTTGQKFKEDTGTSEHYIQDTTKAVVAGENYTFSAFVKETNQFSPRRNIQLTISGAAAGSINYNPFTAEVTVSGTVLRADVIKMASGWLRIFISVAATSTGTLTCRIQTTSALAVVFAGSTGQSQEYAVWGVQLEQGHFPTSYIPTTAAAVTRAADIVSVNTLGSWFNPDAGTLMVEGDTHPGENKSVWDVPAELNASDTNFIRLAIMAPRFLVMKDGLNQASLIPVNPVPSSLAFKIAGAYELNNFTTAINGSPVKLSATGQVPIVSKLKIGHFTQAGVDYPLNCHIKRLDYFPRVVPSLDVVTAATF
jgi:hypothetical protein